MRKPVRITIISLSSLLVLVAIAFLAAALYVGKFQLSEYQYFVEHFPYDKNVGRVEDSETAKKVAKELWIERFPAVYGENENPFKGRIAVSYYDAENECWHVTCVFIEVPGLVDRGGSGTMIKKDGEVLAVWHYHVGIGEPQPDATRENPPPGLHENGVILLWIAE